MMRRADLPSEGPGECQEDDTPEYLVLHLDRLIHEPARLVILVALCRTAEADFKRLEQFTKQSSGNVSAQTNKLEEAGYITIQRYFQGKMPASSYRLTPAGREAITAYWVQMRRIEAAMMAQR